MSETKEEYLARWKEHDTFMDRLRDLDIKPGTEIIAIDYEFLGDRLLHVLADMGITHHIITRDQIVKMFDETELWMHKELGNIQDAIEINFRTEIEKMLKEA